MTTSAPALVRSTLGKLVQIGGWAMYVRRLTGADLFRITFELEHGERAEADFFVREGKVLLMFAQAGILMPFGGGDIGRARLQAALQAALKLPAPKVSAELAELNAARQAWKSCRNLANARRFNRAWCRYHASAAR